MSTVAFLGLGNMGAPMAANLVKAGHDLTVWNRSPAKAEKFAAEHGASIADAPAVAAKGAEFVVSMLADDSAVLDAYTGDCGVLTTIGDNVIAIDMSTIAPETVAELYARTHEAGGRFVDAPVSGSVAAAAAGTLTIMAGGDSRDVEDCTSVLSAMGDPVIGMGASGRGAAMKLAVNAIVHGLNGAVSESLVLAERAGISREDAYAVFLNSAVAAPFVQYRQAAFERPDEVPTAFRLALAAKDLRNALALASQTGTHLPHAARSLEILEQAAAAGFADHDESAVAEYLRLDRD
jgi:3-hydroxyisobutyrate dehydrogenase-like beta-hydroxyacid dehydrogenase